MNLPRNEEAERGLVGSLIVADATYEIVSTALSIAPPEMLFSPFVQAVYLAAVELHRDDGKPELTLLLTYVERQLKNPPNDLVVTLVELFDAVPNAGNVAFYARQVRESHEKRQAVLAAHRLIEANGENLDATLETLTNVQRQSTTEPECYTFGELLDTHQVLREPIIEGLLRRGETMNVIAPSKVGKSWLVSSLAFQIALGREWLGMECHQGKVLIADNELHPETMASRLRAVSNALEIVPEDIEDRVKLLPLRGHLKDLKALGPLLRTHGRDCSLVILDAFYRFLPAESDENSNAQMAHLYNHLDSYAREIGCSFAIVHHSSKGSQAGKTVTDVGSGAGSMARATDTHLVLRHHEVKGVAVMDAVGRSWPPIDPMCLEWKYPLWTPSGRYNPANLWDGKSPRREEQSEPWDHQRFARECVDIDHAWPLVKILMVAADKGLPNPTAKRFLEQAECTGLVHMSPLGRKKAWIRV